MRQHSGRFDIVLGGLPALATASLAEPFLTRRAVNVRWLAAIVLMGTAAAVLMASALYTALGFDAHFASAPVSFRRVRADGDPQSARADRLALARPPGNSRARIEQLNDSGLGMRAFTHVTARLDRAQPIAVPVASVQAAPTMTAAPKLSSAAVAAFPSLIRFGAAGPKLPVYASAYAAPENSGWRPIARQLGAPLNVTDIARSLLQRETRRVVAAGAGDKLSTILAALGVGANDAQEIAAQVTGSKWFGEPSFSGGERIVLVGSADDGSAAARPLKVRVERPGQPAAIAALADDGHYRRVASDGSDAGTARPDSSDGTGTAQRGSVDMSLADSIDAVGRANRIDRSLLDEMARLCAHDVDLDTPVSVGDSIDFLYSADDHGQPELAFVALTAAGKPHHYYRFSAPDDASTDYYDANGHSVTKFLLRKPVAEGRLNDGFGWRIHPILQDRRFHEGVDYDAPLGSPIAAAGAGVVEKIDEESGYGKYIRIRHDLGYETTYAHVAGFARGLKVGDRVRQGQTIAYVGSTGLSTGSHLYCEVRINGRNVDPLSVHLASGRILSGGTLRAFEQLRSRTDTVLAASASSPSRNLP